MTQDEATLNPKSFYFKTGDLEYFRYSEGVYYTRDKDNNVKMITTSEFEDAFSKLSKTEQAYWLKWELDDKLYWKWSKQ